MSGCLNFGRLRVGQQVLGVIKTVNDFDMVIGLPNQLTGFVACDRVSASLAAAFAVLGGAVEPAAENDATGGVDLNSFAGTLTAYYRPSEMVICSIVAIEKDAATAKTTGKKGRHRIELSLRPESLNSHLPREILQSGSCLLMGTIASREDHGYTIDFGLGPHSSTTSTESPRGFLPDTEVDTGSPLIGKSMPFLIRAAYDVKQTGRVLSATLDRKAVAEAVLAANGRGGVHRDALLPGTLVHAEVKAIHGPRMGGSSTTGGKCPRLVVSCGGGHEGRIDILGLPEALVRRRLRDLDWSESFPLGKRLLARVVHMDREEGQWLLSCLEPIVQWNSGAWLGSVERLGEIYETATVLRIDPGLGVLLQLKPTAEASHPPEPVMAYCHISRLSDEHVERIDGPYKVGSKHRARLIDYDAFGGLYQASLQTSILKECLLLPTDVHPGQVVRGKVIRLESYGVLVALTDRIRALCPVAQLVEAAVNPETVLQSLHLGQRYKFRVLDADPASRRITLTRKRGLLDSTLPLLTAYEQAVAGNWHDGWVAAIRDFGVIVRFWAGLKGIITVGELADDYVSRPQEAGLFVGQVVRCRIVKCDPSRPELVLSLRRASGPKNNGGREEGAAKRRKVFGGTDKDSIPVLPERRPTIDDLVSASA